MRIVAGRHKGRRLQVPKNKDIRPTSDKVRGAIFNALISMGAVEGAQVLDGFCGTGALGLEALSRGAAQCTFTDKARASLDLAKANAQDLGAMDHSTFHVLDIGKSFAPLGGSKYDLVFLDPPYRMNLLSPVLKGLLGESLLSDGAVLVLEAEKSFEPECADAFTLQFEKIYGDTKVMCLTR